MTNRDIVVIGASTGSIAALSNLMQNLPLALKAAVFIVLHIPPHAPKQLPEILGKAGQLKTVSPKDGEEIEPGKIYIAPPDHHLILEEGRMVVKKGPSENYFRPSIDVLFRSAAFVYGPRVMGIILSGILDDGTAGLYTIQRFGGLTIVQDPEDAQFPYMPENVLQYVHVDYTVSIAEMLPLIRRLVEQPAPKRTDISAREMKMLEKEIVIAAHDNAFEMGIMELGEFTQFTCPECHGALLSLKEGTMVRFRCHTGHAFSASALLAGISSSIEEALVQSLRGLEETIMLLKSIGEWYQKAGNTGGADIFFKKADEMAKRAQAVHGLVYSQEVLSEDVKYEASK